MVIPQIGASIICIYKNDEPSAFNLKKRDALTLEYLCGEETFKVIMEDIRLTEKKLSPPTKTNSNIFICLGTTLSVSLAALIMYALLRGIDTLPTPILVTLSLVAGILIFTSLVIIGIYQYLSCRMRTYKQRLELCQRRWKNLVSNNVKTKNSENLN